MTFVENQATSGQSAWHFTDKKAVPMSSGTAFALHASVPRRKHP